MLEPDIYHNYFKCMVLFQCKFDGFYSEGLIPSKACIRIHTGKNHTIDIIVTNLKQILLQFSERQDNFYYVLHS